MIGVTAALSLLLASDPRIELVTLQQRGELAQALKKTEELLAERPDEARRLGLHYLHGHLLDRTGQRRAACGAYAEAMTATPVLEPYARLHIALDQESLGHPEVAAGLTATLLGNSPPRDLVRPASELLARSLRKGGDCRLLTGLSSQRFPGGERRVLELARADCAFQAGETATAQELLIGLLREKASDTPAREAAERLAALTQRASSPDVVVLLGTAFHFHRDFDRSAHYLEQLVVTRPARTLQLPDFETQYRWVRSHFWRGRYDLAAAGYGDLATRAGGARETAQALYHQGRALELAGSWSAASNSYQKAYLAQPLGDWSAASLLGSMRLEFRRGREEEGLEIFALLPTHRQWRYELARGALFLASSDIVRGLSERAAPWLATAEQASRSAQLEVLYWRGRLAELEEEPKTAIEQYLRVLRRDGAHPLAQDALRRLRSDGLAVTAREIAVRLAESQRSEDLHSAWLILGGQDELGRKARAALEERLERDRGVEPFLGLQEVPIEDWPLWQARLTRPEELLLALGIWEEGAQAATRHFPLAKPSLALTASRRLALAGRNRHALWIAEVLRERVPKRLPDDLLPAVYRELLYPLSFWPLVEQAAGRRQVDPFLLAAIIREESRFDPKATSSASARGLTQFVFPTAQRLAKKIGLAPLRPADLEDPVVAIELGAAYLDELKRRYDGQESRVVAAYNAGEPQVEVWRSHCYSGDDAEFYTKVTFRETRSYLAKVLRSRAHYAQLYAPAEP